jgi:DNA polymerase (family 10)
MDLKYAKAKAEKIVETLLPWCDKIEIAGSIRRGKPAVHDIDIVAIPSNQGQFLYALQQLGEVKGGAKILQCFIPRKVPGAVQVDIYIATPETWATLLLIRTGSAAHNISLCSRAKSMGMRLHADGRGLEHTDSAVAVFGVLSNVQVGVEPVNCSTEADIFKALGLPFKRPEERE